MSVQKTIHDPKEIIQRYFKVDPKDIVFIKAVLESYEGMVVVRTLEAKKDILQLLVASDFLHEIEPVIGELQSQVLMEPVELEVPTDFLAG